MEVLDAALKAGLENLTLKFRLSIFNDDRDQ